MTGVSPLALMNFNALGDGLGITGGYGGAGATPGILSDPGFSFADQGSLVGTPNINPSTSFGYANPSLSEQLGGPLGIAGAGLSALSSLGSLWMGMKSMKLAKKQFKFQKDFANTNLANSIQSYNTALADRARSRGVMEGQTQGQVDGYIAANALSRDSGKNGPTPTSSITGAALSNYSQYASPGYRSSQTTPTSAPAATPQDDDEG